MASSKTAKVGVLNPKTGGSDKLRWLLLMHQLPPKPDYFRVKVWRRLQALGAVAIRNSVYALPLSDSSHEDFQWVLREIVEGGGDGSICEARFIDGLSEAQVVDMFRTARAVDYEALGKDARPLAKLTITDKSRSEVKETLVRLQKRFAEIVVGGR